MNTTLDITQEFMMLASDEAFRSKSDHSSIYAIGAIFIDLLLKEQISLDNKEFVNPAAIAPAMHDYKERVFNEVNKAKKARRLKDWIQYYYYHSKLKTDIYDAIMGSLIEMRLLEEETTKWLIFFTRKAYVDMAQHRDSIIQKIRAELLEDGEISEYTISLVLLLEANGMLKHFFSPYEHQALKSRLDELHHNQLFSKINTIKKAVEEIDAAAAATVVIISS